MHFLLRMVVEYALCFVIMVARVRRGLSVSVCLSVRLSVRLSVCLSVCL